MLSRLSVKRPYTVVVAVIMVLILGTISFINLKTDLLPNIDLPYLLIMTNYPGASPEEVEMAVTKPIEQVVATTSNIKNISSISSENSSTVILEFNNDVNMDSSVIEINGMLDLIKPAWNDSIGSPMLMRLNPDMMPIMIASVDVKDTDIIDISQLVSQSIIPELESVNGVASVSGAGLIEEKIEVLIDNSKIDDLNKRVLDAVDSELLEAEDKLADAKKEIEDGKSKLKSEEKKQNARLLEGEKALTAAKQQMTEAEMQMDAGRRELERAQSELRGKLDEVTKQEKELNALKSRLEGLSSMIPEMGEDEIKAIIGGILAGLPKEIKDRMGSDLLAIRKRLEEGGLVMPDEAGSLITEISNRLNESLEMISAGKTELEKGLEEISKKIEELDDSKALLASKKEEMGKKEQELTVGKLMLTIEMDKAKDKLEIGEATLEEKMEEFETARDQAFKKASLDGVITSDMIAGILVAQNFSMPAGSVSEEGTDYLVKVGDKFKDIDELQRLMLFDTGDKGIGKIYLEDVADVSKIDNSDETYAKVNGNNAVMLTFQKQSGFATAEVAESLRERFEKISEENKGLNITPLMDQGVYIDIVVDSVLSNVIYGGILAILILLLFLKDIKPTFIIAVSIPISLIFAIAMMYFTGVNINIISLAGLALGVGMLVDNSIVAIENIYRLRNEGKSAIEASIEGAGEIAGAIIASTLTTVCVFLPIVFVKGISRQLFVDMGLTIAYSLIASLIVALTLVPTMASGMLKKTNEKRNKTFDWFSKWYLRILKWFLKHGVVVIVSVVILLGLSLYLGLSMGTAFIPTMEAPQMSVSIKIPDEDSTGDIVTLSDTVIDRIMGIEGIETIGAFQGGGSGRTMAGALGAGMFGGGSGGTSNLDSMNLYLLLDENKKITNAEIENQIYRFTEDLDCEINVSTSDMNISALAGSGIEVIVKGRDLDTHQDIAADVADILRDTQGTVEVSEGSDNVLTEVRIVVDKEKAMENGLTIAQVFSNVSSDISKGESATVLSGIDKDYPIIVIDKDRQEMDRDDLENLTIKVNKDGEEEEIRVGDIAKITEGIGLSSIRHESQERYLSVTAGIDTGYNIGLVSRDFENKLEDYEVPVGYSIEAAGENQTINNSLRDLLYMLLLAIALIYLIMVAQFQSLLSPFIVMFTIPLAFTGGLMALYITGSEISLISMLGFLVLSGVVVNNGIVFVDFANQLRQSGLSVYKALIQTGEIRLKPILMTAITTILGLFTLSLGVGMGSEMLQPLAIVSIGGLIYATILTLLVIPVMYNFLHRKGEKKALAKEGK